MPGESLSFDITANDRASRQFRDVGNAAADASVKMDLAAASMKVFDQNTQKMGKAAATSEAAMKSHAKATALLADAENVLAGRATTTTKLMTAQRKTLDDLASETVKAGKGFGDLAGSGGLQGGGMGALIAAGAIFAPVLVTAGAGLAAFGLAAAGAGKKSQQFKNELVPLKASITGFQDSMRPVVLQVFGKGIADVQILLRGLAPSAAATGKALSDVFGALGAEFQSRQFQQFFQFIAAEAGPDIRLLGQTFIELLKITTPLITSMHGISVEAVNDVNGILKLIGAVESLVLEQHKLQTEAAGSSGLLGRLANAAGQAFHQLVPGAAATRDLAGWLAKLGASGNAAADGTKAAADDAAAASRPFYNLTSAVTQLNTQMTTLVGNLLTLQGDNVAWKQSMEAARKQLASNSAGLAGNTKNALANKQAIISSTNAAITFASTQLTTGKDIDGATRTIQGQIRFLQSLHDKSSFVRSELAALRREEELLNKQRINQIVHVSGSGVWTISPGHGLPGGTVGGINSASGRLVTGGTPGRDSVLINAMPGELVVPAGMVNSGAVDHLRGSIPGFAAGGVVPSYSGAVSGLSPWIKGNDAATIRLIDRAVVAATLAGIRAAVHTAAGGPGGGAPAANAALARQMYPAWGSGAEWAAWNYLAMRESGWNQYARNPTSGAYGIAQALPPTKYPFAGQAAGGSNPRAQIGWMIGYIASRYGDPVSAAAHEAAFNWYDRGGLLKPGLTLAYNGTGRAEQVLPPGGRPTVVNHVTVVVGHGTHPVAAAQEIVKLLNVGARNGVKLRTSILGPG